MCEKRKKEPESQVKYTSNTRTKSTYRKYLSTMCVRMRESN